MSRHLMCVGVGHAVPFPHHSIVIVRAQTFATIFLRKAVAECIVSVVTWHCGGFHRGKSPNLSERNDVVNNSHNLAL